MIYKHSNFPYILANGHITLNIPVLVRSLKSSNVEPRNEHGGFLLGIGLLGQLDSLQAPDLYQHLKSAHDTTTIGILLGRAASQMGKKDDSDTRMMCLHIPALLPQNLLVDISLPV